MSFMRDKDAGTRGIGAVAALDKVSGAGRRAQAARALAMARRDRVLSRVAMGAVSTGYRQSSPATYKQTIDFESGRPPPPKNPIPGSGFVKPITGGVSTSSPFATKYATTKVAMQEEQVFGVKTTPGSPTPPPPLPPPVVVVDPVPRPTQPPPSSGGSSSSGGGGGGGGGGAPYPSRPRENDLDTVSEQPVDVPSSSSSPQISGTTLAIGAAALFGAYLLFKKKA